MAPTPEPLAISSSKKKLVGFGVGSVACAAFGVRWWMVADAALVGTGVAVIGIGFFALGGLYCFVKMWDRRPGLVLDRDGIIDNSTGVAAGRVRWEEITDIRFRMMGRQRFVTIDVVDPRRFVERGGAVRRLMTRLNTTALGSPINIATDGLAISPDELFRQIEIFYAAYGRRR